MDDKVRVGDAEFGLAPILILITFLGPIWKSKKKIYNIYKLWEGFTKIAV